MVLRLLSSSAPSFATCLFPSSSSQYGVPTIPPTQLSRPPSSLQLRPPSSSRISSLTASARRRKHDMTSVAPTTPISAKEKLDDKEEDNLDEDAFEALFALLEEDLKNDDLSINDIDDEITEEDLANLEKELEDVLCDEDYDEISRLLPSDTDNIDSDDEEPENRLQKLKNWQLRRLAAALKIGRRKTNIKNLSAELGLDRAIVLELLRDPPPNLLLLSASLPDNIVQQPLETENKPEESPPLPAVDPAETIPETKVPVHVMQTRWSAQKRLKKVQVEILEKVYYKTKRPTNAMVSSIVHVTNLPRKRIVKWFEDKRAEEGIPQQRVPFHRHATKRH